MEPVFTGFVGEIPVSSSCVDWFRDLHQRRQDSQSRPNESHSTLQKASTFPTRTLTGCVQRIPKIILEVSVLWSQVIHQGALGASCLRSPPAADVSGCICTRLNITLGLAMEGVSARMPTNVNQYWATQFASFRAGSVASVRN